MKIHDNIVATIIIVLFAAQATIAESAESKVNLAPDMLYKKECGSCHMAYPAQLLPAKFWQKIIATLDKHFGDNAEFNASDRQLVLNFLNANSAESAKSRRAKKILSSIPQSHTALRITEVPYIVREHNGIPAKYVKDNPKVGSLSQCDKCHGQAQRGSFDEDEIVIPGHGKWED